MFHNFTIHFIPLQGLEGRSLLRPGQWVAEAATADSGGAWNWQDPRLGRFFGAGDAVCWEMITAYAEYT